MPDPIRVAYTLEQCWHDVPGGTAAASLEVARRLIDRPDIDLVGVAGRHRRTATTGFEPPAPPAQLPLARPWLYETWNRIGWPKVERATGAIDVCHSTTAIPAATTARHVVTVHDIAFIHHPERFTGHGARVMQTGLERCRRADLVACPTMTTRDELADIGFSPSTIRVVPWGVAASTVEPGDVERVRRRYALPADFVVFVGTIEPRKNLAALAAAMSQVDLPLVVVGAPGWGDVDVAESADVRFLGFVPSTDLGPLYAAASIFAYPSLHEGFGLPVLEAMAHGTPVVTSRGTATEEVAGGAAELVDPGDVESIAHGIQRALGRPAELSALGTDRAAACSWDATVDATVACYRELTD